MITCGKFATGVVDTGDGCTLTGECEYFREIFEKFDITQMLFSGAWGKKIHKKT
jgi:hypothetical protein